MCYTHHISQGDRQQDNIKIRPITKKKQTWSICLYTLLMIVYMTLWQVFPSYIFNMLPNMCQKHFPSLDTLIMQFEVLAIQIRSCSKNKKT